MNKLYCIVYRTGGTDNFQWHRSSTFTTRSEAQKCCDENTRLGYRCYVVDYQQSLDIGLPDTYAPTNR